MDFHVTAFQGYPQFSDPEHQIANNEGIKREILYYVCCVIVQIIIMKCPEQSAEFGEDQLSVWKWQKDSYW